MRYQQKYEIRQKGDMDRKIIEKLGQKELGGYIQRREQNRGDERVVTQQKLKRQMNIYNRP